MKDTYNTEKSGSHGPRTADGSPGATPVASALVLFDFDGTITTKDTLIEFIRFYRGNTQFLIRLFMLAPVLGLYALKMIPNWKAKQILLARFFKGESIAAFNARCYEFSTQVLPKLIRPDAANAIARHRQQNATIAVVTASAENWVRPWCDEHGLICLGTRLETKDGNITGNFLGRNCYGDEKVCRIRDHFNLHEFDEIVAYGDTSGDKEMLALAHRGYYKPFRGGET